MKKKFYFKEMLNNMVDDIKCVLFIVFVFGGLLCLPPLLISMIFSYFNISNFETTFGLSLLLEILIASMCCVISHLKEKYYH